MSATVPATFDALRGPSQEQILAAGFLASYAQPTRAHHAQNLKDFYRWLRERSLSVDTIQRVHLELYARELSEVRGLMDSTVANKLATLSRFFRFAQIDGYLPGNPMEFVKRPSVPRLSTTNGLSRAELLQVLDLAQKSSPRDHALLCILGLNGLRIGEVVGANIDDLSRSSGYHVLRVHREKGGETPHVPLAPRTSWAVEQTIYGRTAGPIFLNREEFRMDRSSANRIVKRLCLAAGITKRISAHSLRHTFITLALDAGATVRDVQNSVGHRDSRQVSYYDRNKNSLPRNATHMVAAFVEGS